MNVYANTTMPLHDIFISTELFYRFGTIYRTFLVKITFDACAYVSGAIVGNKILDLMSNAYRACYPELFKPCPSLVCNIVKY